MKEINICQDCEHPAFLYSKIARHMSKSIYGHQIYSDQCMAEGCKCERARIAELNPETAKAIEAQKQTWRKIIQEAIG